MQVEAKTYMYRSYIALKKYNMVMQEITAQAPAVLRAVRVFAQFMQSPSPTSPALGEMEHMLSGMCVCVGGWVVRLSVCVCVRALVSVHVEKWVGVGERMYACVCLCVPLVRVFARFMQSPFPDHPRPG